MKLPRIGAVRTHESTRKLARHVEAGTARILAATLSHQRGRWHVSLSVELPDTGDDGTVTVLRADAAQVERASTRIVREHAIRSLDALHHLAVSPLAAVPLLEPGQRLGFVTRDDAQRAVAEALGFVSL